MPTERHSISRVCISFSQEGLECAVCLTPFEDTEILRLLPKCKHAFHLECVDTWLVSHSTCPLCRHCITSDDLTLVDDLVAARHSQEGLEQEMASATTLPRTCSVPRRLSADRLSTVDRWDKPLQVGASCVLPVQMLPVDG